MLILNSNETVPLYTQLYSQLREHILSGKLPANARLPSVRVLAAELSTSRNTVEGAYQELYAEGYIYSRQRSGYFVSALDQDALPPATPQETPKRSLAPEVSITYRYNFHPARLDQESFPLALWRKCFLDCLRASGGILTQYADPQGERGLRCNIQQYLERSRGVICEPDQIVICAGLQHSLDIVAHLLRRSHAVVAVENPGYHLPRAVFRNNSFTIAPIAVGANGLDLTSLRDSAGTIVYVTPSHQLPLGCVMPVANRLKLIDWATAGRNMIIEDDYDSELRYYGKPIPSLQGLRPDANIIYLGTFSKVLSPALRLSYMVLPHSLLAAYQRVFRDYFSTVSILEQLTLAKFMADGHWERHVRRMRNKYKYKHSAMLQAIEANFGSGATVVGQGAGLHVVLHLGAANSGETEIIRRAAAEGVCLYPFSSFYAAGKPATTTLLLGFGGMTATEIEEGVLILSRLCV
jgi:GntR family transcriptional regulator/MocR family aminotransferase